jgi:hypothetical protein
MFAPVDHNSAGQKISSRESEDLQELSAGSSESEDLPDPTDGNLAAAAEIRQDLPIRIYATCDYFAH